jgi:hypothetical protein
MYVQHDPVVHRVKIDYVIFCAAFLLAGCAGIVGGRYDYNLEVRNIGTAEVSDCTVTSQNRFNRKIGFLVPKAGDTTAGPFKYPYADRWTVTCGER